MLLRLLREVGKFMIIYKIKSANFNSNVLDTKQLIRVNTSAMKDDSIMQWKKIGGSLKSTAGVPAHCTCERSE